MSADASESTVSPAAEASMRRLLLKPTGAHRQAAAVAAMTLCALLHPPETSSAVVKAVEAVGSQSGKTSKKVVIADSGELEMPPEEEGEKSE